MRLAALFLLLLLSPVKAQEYGDLAESERLIQLFTDPAYVDRVSVKLEGDPLELSRRAQLFLLDLSLVQGDKAMLLIEAAGYSDLEQEIDLRPLRAGPRDRTYRFPRPPSAPWKLYKRAPRRVEFRTWPRQADVYCNRNRLGKAWEPLLVDPKYADGEFTLQVPLYKEQPVESLKAADFSDGHGEDVLLLPRGTGETGKLFVMNDPQKGYATAYYMARDHAVSLGLTTVTGLVLFFAVVLPWHRRRQEDFAHARRLKDLQIDLSSEESMLGRRLGQYRLVALLGRGGMASVYSAVPEDTLDEAEARAIKVLRQDMFKVDDEMAKRFRREMQIMTSLRHPNIVRLDDYAWQTGLVYLVLELVEGGTLRRRLDGEAPLPVDEALEMIGEIVAGMGYAHDQGIVHRDLKPDNIMLTKEGVVKIMDFGLARRHDFATVTVSGTAFGTPAYMPPEQIKGERGQDPRSDQYSLGVIVYEMLSGHRPFGDEDPMTLIYKHLSEAPPPMITHRPDLPAEADAVVARMLAKSIDLRYDSLKDAYQALKEAFGPA